MSEHLSYPPPAGPRFADSPSEDTALDSTAATKTTTPPKGNDLWAAPPATMVEARRESTLARATTAESLDLSIPELTGSVELDIPGAAVPVALTGLDRIKTRVLVNGSRARLTGLNTASFPMVDGTMGKIRVGGFPGYPVVKFKRKVIYRHPRPAVWEYVFLYFTLTAPVLGAAVGAIGVLAGFGLAYAYITSIKRGVNVWVRTLIPLALAAGWVFLVSFLLTHYL